MGLNFRKSIKIGPARVNLSKSGVGYSVGAGGVRYTKRAGRKKTKQPGRLGAILRIFGTVLAVCIVVALAAAVYTFVRRFKWILLALVILAVAGLVVHFVAKRRKTDVQMSNPAETTNPAP